MRIICNNINDDDDVDDASFTAHCCWLKHETDFFFRSQLCGLHSRVTFSLAADFSGNVKGFENDDREGSGNTTGMK